MSVVSLIIVVSRKEMRNKMAKHFVIMEYTNANGETKNLAMRSVDVGEFLIKYPNARRVAG
jgi:protein involved in ribonucleotide reduction